MLFKVAGFKINQSALHEQFMTPESNGYFYDFIHCIFFFLETLHFVSSLKVQVVLIILEKGTNSYIVFKGLLVNTTIARDCHLGSCKVKGRIMHRKFICGHETILCFFFLLVMPLGKQTPPSPPPP